MIERSLHFHTQRGRAVERGGEGQGYTNNGRRFATERRLSEIGRCGSGTSRKGGGVAGTDE